MNFHTITFFLVCDLILAQDASNCISHSMGRNENLHSHLFFMRLAEKKKMKKTNKKNKKIT